MTITKYIILGIITAFTSSYPISYPAHIILLKNIFNTNIFNHNYSYLILINVGLIISYSYILLKNITLPKHITKKHLKFLTSNIINITLLTLIPFITYLLFQNIIPYIYKYSLKIIPITFIFNALLLLIVQKKKYQPIIPKTKHFIIISFILSLSIIPGISYISLFIFLTTLFKYPKSYSIKLLLTSRIITIFLLILQNINSLTLPLLPYIIPSITISIISYYITNHFINLYTSNKLNKLILYLILTSIFILFWFR